MARKLTAILAADVVGYSRRMAADEAGTLRAVQQLKKNVFDPHISAHGGRIVKLMGDGALVEFSSVLEAVHAAISIQNTLREAPGDGLKIRIGVNLGDVIIESGDIFGTGVNIAARLQEMAEPGSICISGTVFEQVDGKVDHAFTDLGTQTVKNIDKPVHVYGDFARVMEKKEQPGRRRPFLDHLEEDKPPATGGCLCGAIRYEISKPPIDVGYCHCKMCQRFTGAPIAAGSTFAEDAVKFTKGEVKYYKSSPIAMRGFCENCGSSLTYKPIARRWTGWIYLFAGTLDHAEDFAPEWHLGVESHVNWLHYSDDLPKVRCEDSPGIVEAYEEAEKYSD